MSGCIVTIDAMGCQKAIAQQITEQEADYVFTLKENQGRLYEDVSGFFEYAHKIVVSGTWNPISAGPWRKVTGASRSGNAK